MAEMMRGPQIVENLVQRTDIVRPQFLHSRIRTLFVLSLLAFGVLGRFDVAPSACAAGRPNVIVILTDDQGWGDLSLHGNQNLSTPNLDRLGRLGSRFDRFYVCPVCAPTRAEFLTGRYHPRGGVRGVTTGAERLDLDEKTIAQHFKSAGYATAAYGKWHNGMQYPYHPLGRGFEDFYGYCSGHWGDYFSPQLEHNGRLVRGDGYLVDDFTNRALEFIETNAAREFFLYLPMPTPHSPMQVPDEYWNRHQGQALKSIGGEKSEEDEQFTRAAMAMVECIDQNVGRILSKLDELSLAKDTIVVFFCDNGPNSLRWNGGMKGKKGSTDEGGVRSPLFICWPDQIRGNRVITQISGVIDLLPTLAELTGVPLVGGKPLDGMSLAPLLKGSVASFPNRMLFSHWNKKVSVRVQHFRLDAKGNLYDMLLDPGQNQTVNDAHPEMVKELDRYVRRWKSEMLRGFDVDDRAFPVGHPDFPYTQLPARDGQGDGGIQRSAKAPNCSYFTNWVSEDGKMTWDIDVLEAGNFQVEMYYACPQESIGTEVRLSSGDASVASTIESENDPPAVGAEHDRVPRKTQSLMKDWKPLSLGRIELEAGRQELELSATKFVGEKSIDMRLLMLTRVR
ncbi:MAG: arylsulfatase [Planctomycetota bacterium]